MPLSSFNNSFNKITTKQYDIKSQYVDDFFLTTVYYGTGDGEKGIPNGFLQPTSGQDSGGTLYKYYLDNTLSGDRRLTSVRKFKWYPEQQKYIFLAYAFQDGSLAYYPASLITILNNDLTVADSFSISNSPVSPGDWQDVALDTSGQVYLLGNDRDTPNTYEAVVWKFAANNRSVAWKTAITPSAGFNSDSGQAGSDQWRMSYLETDTQGNLWISGYGKENLYESSTSGKIIKLSQSTGQATGTISQDIATWGHYSPLSATDPDLNSPTGLRNAYVSGTEYMAISGASGVNNYTAPNGVSVNCGSATITQGSPYRHGWSRPSGLSTIRSSMGAWYSLTHSTADAAKYVTYSGYMTNASNSYQHGVFNVLNGNASAAGSATDQALTFYSTLAEDQPNGTVVSSGPTGSIVFADDAANGHPVYVLIGERYLCRYRGCATTSDANNWQLRVDQSYERRSFSLTNDVYMSADGDPLLVGTSYDSDGNLFMFIAKVPADGTGVGNYGGLFQLQSSNDVTLTSDTTPFTWVRSLDACSIVSANEGITNISQSNYTGSTRSVTERLMPNEHTTPQDGLLWIKPASTTGQDYLFDTVRPFTGTGSMLSTDNGLNLTNTSSYLRGWHYRFYADAYLKNGFTVGSTLNSNNVQYVAKTFKKRERFFDIVKWDGNGTAREISHDLTVEPGMIIVKRYDGATGTGDWMCYHKYADSSPEDGYFIINNNAAWYNQAVNDGVATDDAVWRRTVPNSKSFSIGTDNRVNAVGNKYVAYIFADDRFGYKPNNGKIACGTFTTDANGIAEVTDIPWDSQYVVVKPIGSGTWYEYNFYTGMSPYYNEDLQWNSTAASAASTSGDGVYNSPGGFTANMAYRSYTNTSFVYMAIRRPFKTAEEFFNDIPEKLWAGGAATTKNTIYRDSQAGSLVPAYHKQAELPYLGTGNFSNFGPYDLIMIKDEGFTSNNFLGARKLGRNYLTTNSTNTLTADSDYVWRFRGGALTSATEPWVSNANKDAYMFSETPGFLDIQIYKGNVSDTAGTTQTIKHNLDAVPDMMWIKSLDTVQGNWTVYHKDLDSPSTQYLNLNTVSVAQTASASLAPFKVLPTNTEFTVTRTNSGDVLKNGERYIAILWSTKSGDFRTGKFVPPSAGNTPVFLPSYGLPMGAKMFKSATGSTSSDWIYIYSQSSGDEFFYRLNSDAQHEQNQDIVDYASVDGVTGLNINNNTVWGGVVNDTERWIWWQFGQFYKD